MSSRETRRGRTHVWSRRLRRLVWRFIRGLMVLASAIGPGMPRPPPPPPAPTEQVESDGEGDEAR